MRSLPGGRPIQPLRPGTLPARGYAVLAAAVVVLALLAWSPAAPGVWHDDGVYLLLGKALAEGDGLRYVGLPGAPPAPKFPPLYPLALASIWRVAPDFPANAELFQAANVLFLGVAALLFATWAARVLGMGPRTVAAVTLLAWSHPDLWRVAVIPLSEPLFLLALLAALTAGTVMERRAHQRSRSAGEYSLGGHDQVVAAEPRSLRRWAIPGAFAVFAALAFYTRTIGGVVWVAGVMALLLRRSWRFGAGVGVAGTVLVGPWLVWSRWATTKIPEPLQDILGSYGSWLAAQVGDAPGSFFARVPGSAARLFYETGRLVVPGITGIPGWGAALLVAALTLVGLWRIGRTTWLVPLTLALYYAVLVAWPFYDRRLLAPVLPLIVLASGVGVVELWARLQTGAGRRVGVRRVGARELARVAFAVAAAAGAAWLGGSSVAGILGGRHDAAYRIRSEALVRSLQAVRTATPPEAIVGAPELWAAIHLYSGRTSVPSARFLPLAADGPSWGTPADQYTLWETSGIDHLLVEHGGGVHGEALDRLDELCPGGAVQLLATMRGAYLVRLAWDEACRERLREAG